ncbi:MAG: ABC transporter permease [Gemmatimonadaceae bacterium]|nr:ABC transporter permease [Gemmatimonadaceae bacterium]
MTSIALASGDWRVIAQRLRTDRRSLLAGAVLAAMIALVLLGPLLSPYRPYEQLDITHLVHAPPSAEHLLGTDSYSRDVLSRVLSGGRVSLAVATSAVLIEVLVGVLWGLASGLAGRGIDTLMMRIVDAGLSVPRVLLLLALLAAMPSVPVWLLVLVLGLTGWFGTARLVRGEVRTIRGADYVLAARALGATPARLALRHLLPHALGPVLVASTLAVGQVIVLEAGLSWLGIGVQPPQPSWGNIIGDGYEFIASAPWVSLGPGFCLVLVVLAVSALGDGLRDALAPRQLPRT